MVDRPSANRVPLAEIHLRCTSAKEFRRKELMRIKKGGENSREASGSEGEYPSSTREPHEGFILRRPLSVSAKTAAATPSEVRFLHSRKIYIRTSHSRTARPALISGTYRFISRVVGGARQYLQIGGNAAVNIHNSNRSVQCIAARDSAILKAGMLPSRCFFAMFVQSRAIALPAVTEANIPRNYNSVDIYELSL